MNRILIEASGAVAGGVLRVLTEVTTAWPAGDDVHVLAPVDSCAALPDTVTAHPLPGNSRATELTAAPALATRLRRRLRPDAVVSISPSLPGAALSPDVTVLHDLFFRLWPAPVPAGARAYRTVGYRAALTRSRAVACVSGRTRHDLAGWLPTVAARACVWPLAVSAAFRGKPDPEPATAPYVVVPAHTPYKAPELAVSAFPEPTDPQVVLLAGSESRRAELAAALAGAPRRPRVLGRIDDQELVQLVAGAEALVMPSQIEGFGLPVLEALALATPVVVSPDPALWETSAGFAARMRTWDAASVRAAFAGAERLPPDHWRTAQAYALARTWSGAAEQLKALALAH